MCVWVHPDDSAKSAVITSDKKANKLFVYVGVFAVAGMSQQDGIEVVSVGLGPKFPNRLFLCHTDSAKPCPVLLTPWDEIAKTFTPLLTLPSKAKPQK